MRFKEQLKRKMMQFGCLFLVLLLLVSSTSATDALCAHSEEWNTHPTLCHLLQRRFQNASRLAEELHQFAHAAGWVVDLRLQDVSTLSEASYPTPRRLSSSTQMGIPVVLAHGMGDSCFNSGIRHAMELVAQWLNVYTVCIPIGASKSEDTNNGYFLNMDASVDYFAEKVLQDDELVKAGTFHAIGFSQGNNILRGYIARYNTIPVRTFLSVNGVNAGIGAVPHCRPSELVTPSRALSAFQPSTTLDFTMCDLLMEQASHAAYTAFAQEHSFQANYWRDPRPSMYDTYREYSQLAKWSNEVLDTADFNETLRENWNKTQKFVWVMATNDSMVWPPQGEQWGAPDPANPFAHILEMEETKWYQDDLFGLQTAQRAGKNHFESFVGDHLQFPLEDFRRWIDTYLLDEI
jgi:palmitoyl-protein thioesterase